MVKAQLAFFIRQFTYTLTGGLYYEHAAYFVVNLIHFLIYSFFILFPLFFILVFGFGNLFAEIIYASIIFIFFLSIKSFNSYFHYYFDTHSKGLVGKLIVKQDETTPPSTNNHHQPEQQQLNNTSIMSSSNDDNGGVGSGGGDVIAASGNLEETSSDNIIVYHDNNNNNNNGGESSNNHHDDDNNIIIIERQQSPPHHNESSSSSSSSSRTPTGVVIVNHDNDTAGTGSAGITSTDDVIVSCVDNENNTITEPNGATTNHESTTATTPTIPQYDGPSDDNTQQQPEMRTAILEYVDEFGEVHSYEMAVTIDEYNRIMKEKEGKSTTTTNDPSSSTNTANDENGGAGGASSNNRPVNVSRQQLNAPSGAAAAAGSSGAKHDDNYKIVMFGKVHDLFFDRRTLEYLFDRDFYPKLELIGSPLMAFGVAWMGLRLMSLLDRNWASIVFMILSIAQSHFSMLKSPQPEANSPFHYSKGTVYTRAFYVLFFGTIALICGVLTRVPEPLVVIYGVNFHFGIIFLSAREIALYIIMCFPVIFLFGALPQTATFVLVFCEQVNMHLFGASGAVALTGVVIQLIGAIVTIGTLIGVGYTSAFTGNWQTDYYSAIYSAVLVSGAFLLSRMPSNHRFYTSIVEDVFGGYWDNYLPKKLRTQKSKDDNRKRKTQELDLNISGVNPITRIVTDFAIALGIFVLVLIPQLWDAFQRGNPYLLYILTALNVFIGFMLYYIYPHLTKHHPFTFFRFPLLANDQKSFKFIGGKKWVWYEIIYYITQWVELIFYIVIVLSGVSSTILHLNTKCKPGISITIASICGIKLIRCAFSEPNRLSTALFFSVLISHVDAANISEGLLVDFFVFTYVMQKFKEIFLKLGFIIVYSTPLSWASGFHIVMQPLGIPFSQFFFVQLIYSVLSNSPMYPLIGGALWFMGYSRGAKFWEKDYRSKRRDVSNQTLGQTLGGGALDQHTTNNLNSIFYEHLVNALRNRMSEIMRKGQLGSFEQGDIFMFINDTLTAIVHIIEVGNGVVSYQIRGLEFKGTICQEEEQRSILSRINRDQDGMPGFSSLEEANCFPGAPKLSLLSMKDIITLRMHTWQVIQTGVKLKTYNMLENKVENLMSSNDERKEVIILYVRAVLYYVIHSKQLDYWIGSSSPFLDSFSKINDRKADFDPMFSEKFDPDYDSEIGLGGVSFKKFIQIYSPFIDYFIDERRKEKNREINDQEKLNIQKLTYLASLTARRALASFDGTSSANSLRTFIQKVHQLFVGDYRITSTNDEWVFGDLSILDHCIKPAIGMSLSLYQSKFAAEDVDLPDVVSTLIRYDMVITHESDPKWRESIMAEEAPELFSLRKKVQDKGGVDYYILMLSMRDVEFNIVKINKEGVRALWSSQQHELLYLGVEEAERGSIQNMTYTLRNICNSCMDVPIGYPVMVSSVTTAYW